MNFSTDISFDFRPDTNFSPDIDSTSFLEMFRTEVRPEMLGQQVRTINPPSIDTRPEFLLDMGADNTSLLVAPSDSAFENMFNVGFVQMVPLNDGALQIKEQVIVDQPIDLNAFVHFLHHAPQFF